MAGSPLRSVIRTIDYPLIVAMLRIFLFSSMIKLFNPIIRFITFNGIGQCKAFHENNGAP